MYVRNIRNPSLFFFYQRLPILPAVRSMAPRPGAALAHFLFAHPASRRSTDMTPSHPSPASNRWLQLLAACLTAVLIPLCFTGPAVVLPSISQALGGTPVQLNWILNGYILAYGFGLSLIGAVKLLGVIEKVFKNNERFIKLLLSVV